MARLSTRMCKEEDIPRLVDIDMQVFDNYDEMPISKGQLRGDLLRKFKKRLDSVGGDWVRVVEKDDEVVGVMMSCPTSKTPEEFTSWEDTTDNGTLESTYDASGKNIYVVTLSMLPNQGDLAQNMLFANQIGKMIEEGYERGFFESRLPGLRKWMEEQCVKSGFDIAALTRQEKKELADEYSRATIWDENDKEVPLDRLMRVFHRAGCRFGEVVEDAYDDPPSMNFGIVTVYENPLIEQSRLIQKAAGAAIRKASSSRILMKHAF